MHQPTRHKSLLAISTVSFLLFGLFPGLIFSEVASIQRRCSPRGHFFANTMRLRRSSTLFPCG